MRRKDYTLSLPPFIYFPPSSHLVFYRLYCVISNVFSQSEVVYATTQDFSHVQPSRRHQAHSNAITLFTPGSRDIQSPSTTSQSTNPSHPFISPPLPSPHPDPAGGGGRAKKGGGVAHPHHDKKRCDKERHTSI